MPLNINGNIVNSGIVKTLNYSSIVTRGLILHMDAGAPDSYPEAGSTWYDRVNNYSATLYNSPAFNSSNGGSIVFNGSNNYGDISNNLGTVSNYTIGYWAYRDTADKMAIAGRTSTAFYWYGDNSWYYTHSGGAGEFYYPRSVSIPGWGYWVVVYNGSNVSIYRQGTYEGQQSTTGNADFSAGLKIGTWTGPSSYTFQGKIAVVQMYNRALSAAEVSQNYNAQKSRFGL
jgi:Concanavalin A-like lectin/glucanases superfamily